MNTDILIRFAEFEDLQAIVDIYNEAVTTGKTTADLEKITVKERIHWFNEHDKNSYPAYVAVIDNKIAGWCAISPYRAGREALRQTAEISYYVAYDYHGKGIGTALIRHVINDCSRTGIKNIFAILLECNTKSLSMLEKFKFIKWGYMPKVANIDGVNIAHLIYGMNI